MPTASEPYTPEELAALESVADMLSPAECRRLIHQLRQQTARAECADRHEADYLRVVAAALDADPIPACQRDDDQLEPPWEVLTRLKAERQEARAQAWRNAECASAHTTEAHTLSCALASYARERDTWKARAEAAERERLECARTQEELVADAIDVRAERDAARTALAALQDNGPLGAAICEEHRESPYTDDGYRVPDFCCQCRFKEMHEEHDRDVQALTAERDVVNRALAAAEVERARLVAVLDRVKKNPREAQTVFGLAGTDHDPAMQRCYLEGIRDGVAHILVVSDPSKSLTPTSAASPHADLAAVRALTKAAQRLQAVMNYVTDAAADGPGNDLARALAALPSWCREQP